MEKIRIMRVGKGKNSTLSHLYTGNKFLCFLLEDRVGSDKIAGVTCIPEGHYQLKLHTQGRMHQQYLSRFPTLHQGMLEIAGIENFSGVFLHIGNTHEDTRGCPLTGHSWNRNGQDYEVLQSAYSYQYVYTFLKSLVLKGDCEVLVSNFYLEGGLDYGNQH
ncbi:MAG: DUF5675 family protein [Pelobium sp.]